MENKKVILISLGVVGVLLLGSYIYKRNIKPIDTVIVDAKPETVEEMLKSFEKKEIEILWHNRLQTAALILTVVGIGEIFQATKK